MLISSTNYVMIWGVSLLQLFLHDYLNQILKKSLMIKGVPANTREAVITSTVVLLLPNPNSITLLYVEREAREREKEILLRFR